MTGLWEMPTGAHAVTVGGAGQPSQLGTVVQAPGSGPAADNNNDWGAGGYGDGAQRETGYTSAISGAPVEYGKANQSAPRANRGDGGSNVPGSSGIVIVRVQQTPPTSIGVAATGGTETEYTGDGSNGVLGQKYRVHRFTASGNLVVSQGGEADYLIIGGAAGAGATYPGNAGDLLRGKITLPSGTVPVVVGAGGTTAVYPGGASSIGGITTGIAGIAATADYAVGAGSSAANMKAGYTSSITGLPVIYGEAWAGSVPPNSGTAGGLNTPGATGVVIVRYEIA